jgi:hypothetical protein
LSCEYLREFSKKIRNDRNGIIRGLGETDSRKKTRSKKSRDTVPLKRVHKDPNPALDPQQRTLLIGKIKRGELEGSGSQTALADHDCLYTYIVAPYLRQEK